MLTRRQFAGLALAAPVALGPGRALGQARRINSTVNGVMLGAQSYSFREKSFDDMVAAFVETGLGECELFSPHIEPRLQREVAIPAARFPSRPAWGAS